MSVNKVASAWLVTKIKPKACDNKSMRYRYETHSAPCVRFCARADREIKRKVDSGRRAFNPPWLPLIDHTEKSPRAASVMTTAQINRDLQS